MTYLRTLTITLTAAAIGCGAATTAEPEPEAAQVARVAAAEPDPAAPSEGMVELEVASIEVGLGGIRLLLKERGGLERTLPMMIGESEGSAIQRRLARQRFSRPLTHDLFESALEELGARVIKLEIDDLREGVFLGRLILRREDGELLNLDTRPSDGVALAVGADAPIYVTEQVLASITPDEPAEWPPDSMPQELAEALKQLLTGAGEPPSAGLTVEPGAPLTAPILAQVYSCWFENPYGYMFHRGEGESVSVHGTDYKRFMGGVSGILYYGDLAPCLGRLVGVEQGSYNDNGPIAAVAGLPLHSDEMKPGKPFGFYNPDLVRWGHENLIPSPETQVAGLAAGVIYDVVFARFFRMMAESRLWLIDSGRYKREMKAYWKMAKGPKNPRRDGISWLQKRYKGKLERYQVEWDGTSMTPQMAIGFWLRRGLDGTEQELWVGLRKVLTTYDPDFFASLKKRYESKKIDW
jgi:bifunctional DNase/RNase